MPGTYYVRETSAKEPYLVGEEIEVNIPADMNLTPVAVASYYDHAATGNIRIASAAEPAIPEKPLIGMTSTA